MVSISIILPTAREDYSIVGLPNLHMFQSTIESLKKQSFKDFELIIIDALWHLRSGLFEKGGMFDKEKLGFNVKHIPVEHNKLFNHSFWLSEERRRWAVSGTLNTALIHAKGELVVRIDDCSMFDSDYIKKFWDNYQTGLWAQAMHIRWLGDKPACLNEEYRKIGYEYNSGKGSGGWDANREELLKKLYGENGLIRDTRYQTVKDKGGRMIIPSDWPWTYGYTSFPLDVALKVNGYCELMDGQKSLEDVDFGSRLSMAGYSGKFVLDIGLQVIEYEHLGISTKIIDPNTKPIVCNYAIYLINKKKNIWKANSRILSEEDIEFIRKESLKPPCSPEPNFYDDNCRGKMFDIWKRNQPIFDLKEERKLYE